MKEDLLRYMSLRPEKKKELKTTTGPLVTISREKGCPANSIAEKLAGKLNVNGRRDGWKWVNKEIMEDSARELHINPSKINHVIYSEDKGFFRDLVLSFGEKYYRSDVKIKKTLAELILGFASDGKVIVVGLGGVAITRGIRNALHVKLFAPYKHRLKEVMKVESMGREKAREYMEEADINRQMLIDYFNGFKAGTDLYHAQFNCSLLSEDEIVKAIHDLMKLKDLI